MNHKREEFEIMAPVGSYESLQAAIQAGANSVYFGIEKLNMRSRSASNFTTDDLREIVKICKENGVKSYLTLNTVMYNDDLALMREIIDTAKEVSVSAIIAADVAAMLYAFQQGVEVHLSTQLNISNVEALKFYAQFADVVVLARELNMEQVAAIYKAINEEQIKGPKGELIKIEMFCHGALCMAISGKCYMSLHELNASANRGACYQICRHSYRLIDDERDIEIKDIIATGVEMNAEVSPQLLVNIFEPDTISIGGSFAYYEDLFLPRLKAKLNEPKSTLSKKVVIVLNEFIIPSSNFL